MDNNHHKPTPEELEAEQKRILEKLEKPEDDTLKDKEVTAPDKTPEEKVEDTDEDEVEVVDEVIPPVKPPLKEEPKKEETDFKKKFSESSREAQVIAQSKKQLEDRIDEAQNMPVPTDQELQAEYPEWDTLTDFEKRMGKETLHNKNINNRIRQIRTDQKEAEGRVAERREEVSTFVIKPDVLEKFPKLEGRQDEFIAFATKPTRMTLDIEDLAKLFIIDIPATPKHKGGMFPAGTGGPNTKETKTSDKISVEDSIKLRETNYKLYKEMLNAGKIANE